MGEFNKILGMHYRCPECGAAVIYKADNENNVLGSLLCINDGYQMKTQPIWENCEIEKTFSDNLTFKSDNEDK